jgi:hypothetical protein
VTSYYAVVAWLVFELHICLEVGLYPYCFISGHITMGLSQHTAHHQVQDCLAVVSRMDLFLQV